jgi:hypothetical protein
MSNFIEFMYNLFYNQCKIDEQIEIINKLSNENKELVLQYSKTLYDIQKATEKKQRNCYNQRLGAYKEWEYMTKDILENHKKTLEETTDKPHYVDITYRSRYTNVRIHDNNKFIFIFCRQHNKVIMADYLMFNKYYNVSYDVLERLLGYCKISFKYGYTSSVNKIDGWIFETHYNGLPGNGLPGYHIKYDNSDYDELPFVKTDEEKRLTVRLLIQVMNETPEEYVNLHNYNVICQWYRNNDIYLSSYNTNIFQLERNKKDDNNLEKNEIPENELILQLDDKVTNKEIIYILESEMKYGKNDIYELGITDKEDIVNIDLNDMVEINTKQLDLRRYYKENGYIKTKTVLDQLQNMIKYRINCNNYLKHNQEKITKAELLTALYNSCMAYGMGVLVHTDKKLTIDNAENLLKKKSYFDYENGIALKISFREFPIMDFQRFDKYNGDGQFMNCIYDICNSS